MKGFHTSMKSRLYVTVKSCSAGFYLLNNVCTACPDAALQAAGVSTCQYIGYVQSSIGSAVTYNYQIPAGAEQINVYALGAKGGDLLAPPALNEMPGDPLWCVGMAGE